MLRNIPHVYVKPGEPEKLWFTEESLDLFIWLSQTGEIQKLQFTYDKPYDEKSVLWDEENGLRHNGVDDGSRPGKHPSTPILLADIPFDEGIVARLLDQHKQAIPSEYFMFIQKKLRS